ncbi:hypothetical protein ACFSR6_07785 [Pedobacter vanadiisoli]|uniref:Uncharacterized protein n=1 Tax=Pedobacter vanadiisoli TaxID=1761975 RepID=A0ABW5MKV0_9SPHI
MLISTRGVVLLSHVAIDPPNQIFKLASHCGAQQLETQWNALFKSID